MFFSEIFQEAHISWMTLKSIIAQNQNNKLLYGQIQF